MVHTVKVEHEGSDLVGTYEFPDDTTVEEMKDALTELMQRKEPQQKGPTMFEAMIRTAENEEGLAKAVGQFGLAMAYLNGTDGAQQSNELTKLYLEMSAKANYAPAQEVLKTFE